MTIIYGGSDNNSISDAFQFEDLTMQVNGTNLSFALNNNVLKIIYLLYKGVIYNNIKDFSINNNILTLKKLLPENGANLFVMYIKV